VPLGCFFHRIRHRRRVSVEAHAGILNIEDEGVEALEHFIGRPARLAVQTENRESGCGIGRGWHSLVSLAGEAVLGT